MLILSASRPDERGVRVVTNVGRGAMDARCAAGRACACADGEVVWSWRPDAGVKRARWRCQPYGLDTPVALCATEANKPGTPGRARSSR